MQFYLSFFLFFVLSSNLLPQTSTKQDIQMLIKLMEKQSEQIDKRFEQVDKRFEMMQEQNRIIREDMNKRFEQVDKRFEMMQEQNRIIREDMNKRFENLFWFIGILYGIGFGLLIYILREIHRIERKKVDIEQLEQQIYQAKPEIKAKIYFNLKEEAEKYRQRTSQ